MTDREPAPAAPSCPICGQHDRVKREQAQWLCGGCWTLFTSSQGEWEQNRDLRERRANAYRWISERAEKQEVDA